MQRLGRFGLAGVLVLLVGVIVFCVGSLLWIALHT